MSKILLKKIMCFFVFLLYISKASYATNFYVMWHDIDLNNAARIVSQYSERIIRLAPKVHGTISLSSPDPLTADGVFNLFQAALEKHKFTLVRTENGEYWIRENESSSMNVNNTMALSSIPSEPQLQLLQRYTAVIFNLEQRAQDIALRLRTAGVSATVQASNDPDNPVFSVVLYYQNNPDEYQNILSSIENAGLSSLISVPEEWSNSLKFSQKHQ